VIANLKPFLTEALSTRLRTACQSTQFYQLLGRWDCGAIDGGCLIVAEALHEVFGAGELWGLYGFPWPGNNRTPLLHHALLKIDNLYLDGDGISSEAVLCERWLNEELICVTDLAPIKPAQIQVRGAAYHSGVVQAMSRFFRHHLFDPLRNPES
jgi:hypothetical protein